MRRPGEVVIDTAGGWATGWRSRRRRWRPCPAAGERGRRCTATSSCATTRMQLFGFATEAERDLFLMLDRRSERGAEGGAGGALRRNPARAAGRDRDRRRRHASRPCRGSASARPSGSSSSCKREGGGRRDATRSWSRAPPTTRARSRARAWWASASRPHEADELLDSADGETPEDLISEALKAAR